MIRFLLAIIVILGVSGSYAEGFADSAEQNAFLFAGRKDWSNALAYAKQADDPVLVKLITWEYLLDADSGVSFGEIAGFIDANPSWPDQKKLHLRAEMALHSGDVPDKKIIAWFGSSEPVSGVGKIALAEALVRSKSAQGDKINLLIREAWRSGDFDEPQEKKLLEDYGSLLRHEDHIARIDRLLWEERITPAKRVLHLAPEAYQKLFKARMALIEDKRLAVVSLAQVPSALKGDAGLVYDRMAYRSRREDDNGVRDMLLAAPAHPPYPEKWWKYREYQTRRAIDVKKYALAKKLLAGHGQTEGSGLADAMWLQGWLLTEFMKDPKGGYENFYKMYGNVRYPVSKARAAYWAGRAAEKNGNAEVAKKWYGTAANYPTTFYGQLGALKAHADSLHIPEPVAISAEARRDFESSDVVQAIKLCIHAKALEFAKHLLSIVIDNSDDEAEIAMLSELGEKAGYRYLSVHAAKKALQQNVVLIDAGYPTPKTPADKPIERALTLAIVRQESEFDPAAHSPSGAVGMMQLLPGTAKEIAHKHDMKFSGERLLEPDYNMTLGSLYLGRLIGSYDGSYVMAIAAYNAGPGNIHNWAQEFGTPGNDVDNAVDWIEKIPYKETRNYVQRVMENLQVFRHIEADEDAPKVRIGEDLVR